MADLQTAAAAQRDNAAARGYYDANLEAYNAYARARTANIRASSDIPQPARAQLDGLLFITDAIVGAAQSAQLLAPAPKLLSLTDPYVKQFTYSQGFILPALDAKADYIDQQMALIGTLPQDIAAAALAGTAPQRPGTATDAQVADRKADLTAIAQAATNPNGVLQAVIHAAVKSGDDLTLYVLCSEPMAFTLQAIKGANQATLQRVCADARVELDPRAADPLYLGSKILGYAFVALQDGDQGCKNLAPLAKAYADGMIAASRRVLALPSVMANASA